ncbi:MAG: transglycosylase SLT domain-containing protein [Actinomycetia bacterium]|nr:transglycosylase SLT domain-containing protein [Actinomycetes bacterium]
MAAQLEWAHGVISNPTAPPEELDRAGHLHQVAYRKLGRNPEWDDGVAAALPARLVPAVLAGAGARRPFKNLLSEPPANLPAWEIVEPVPADELLAHYREAETVFGIPWQYLAAINLVETGMGRIRGLSTAGARGPMQFIPATWERFGEGDIDDPRDSIMAAARYLSYEAEREGGPVEPGSAALLDALWHYNNHDSYVIGVKAFADLMIADERAFYGYHQWEIYYWSTEGDIWLPVGWRSEESIPAAEWVAANPQG